jgi:hypothetical protein
MTSYDEPEFDEPTPPEESSNRTFLLVAGILGGLVLLGLLCIAGYFFFRNASNQQNQGTAIAQATQQEATIQAGVTQTSIAQRLTQTAAVTNTVPPTSTPVIAEATATFSPSPAPATVTVAAAFTQLANSTQTIIPTSTGLPNTGFADDLGASGLILVAIALVAVIFLVRRLRSSPT